MGKGEVETGKFSLGKTWVKIFSARKLGVNFSRNSSSSNEFIGYVDLSDFYESLGKMIVGYWGTKVCRSFKKFEIFLL